jgi:hypothetical protein
MVITYCRGTVDMFGGRIRGLVLVIRKDWAIYWMKLVFQLFFQGETK